MGAVITRFDPRYWPRRAAAYREQEMQRDMMVQYDPLIRRVAVVDYKIKHGRREAVRYSVKIGCRALSNCIADLMSYRDRVRTPYIHRVWQVGWYQPFESYERVGFHTVQEWGHLVMAQAHLEALRYHYARHLMTRETAAEGM